MSDIPVAILLATWPLPDAVSALHHELRGPLVTMRATVEWLHHFGQTTTATCDLQPLMDDLDRIANHLDRLLGVRNLVDRYYDPAPPAHGQRRSPQQLIAPMQEIIARLRQETLTLQQRIQAMLEMCSRAFTAEGQQLLSLFQSGYEAWGVAIESTFFDVVIERLRTAEKPSV